MTIRATRVHFHVVVSKVVSAVCSSLTRQSSQVLADKFPAKVDYFCRGVASFSQWISNGRYYNGP